MVENWVLGLHGMKLSTVHGRYFSFLFQSKEKGKKNKKEEECFYIYSWSFYESFLHYFKKKKTH